MNSIKVCFIGLIPFCTTQTVHHRIGNQERSLIYQLPENAYHKNWKRLSLTENQQHGDRWMNEKKWPGFSVRSAINEREYNCLLNPLYPGFHDLVKVISVNEIGVDHRLAR